MNDGFLQHMRVGACAGLGTKYLSRKNSKVLAMIGSGGMARTYAMAIKEVRPIETMRVFSPTKANRERYAQEMTEQLDIEVVAGGFAGEGIERRRHRVADHRFSGAGDQGRLARARHAHQ